MTRDGGGRDRRVGRGQRALDGLDEDIRDHLERVTQDNIDRGMTPEEARRQALLAFGNVTLVKEDTRAVWIRIWLEQLRQDIRYAWRTLRRSPGFAAIVILTLGLGIGANTAIFSLMDQVMLRALPVDRPEELALIDAPGIYQGRTTGTQVMSVPMFRGLSAAKEADVLSGVFARFDVRATIGVGNSGAGSPGSPGSSAASSTERGFAELVSGNYFRTLGVGTALGRTLGPEDDRVPGAHPVVVLSHAYWQRRFGGDAGVLGRDIRINGHVMTIVGVAQPGFNGVDLGAPVDLFVPLMMKPALTPTWNDLDSWRSRWVTVMGRLAPGVSHDRVAAALNVRYRQLLHEDVQTARVTGSERDQFLRKNLQVMAGGRGKSAFRDQFATPLIVVMAMVGLVLIVACANVANLMLARSAARQKDVALRLALGASRWRIVRQRLAESVVLAAGGTVVGLLIASWTTRLLIQMLPFERAARALSSELDIRVVGFALAAAAATVLLFGLAPALQARSAAALTMALKETGRVAGGGSQAGFRKALVIAQVALSMLLLAGAGLFARSLHNLRGLDPGFVPDNLLHFSLDSSRSGYTRERSIALAKTLQEQLRMLPGVTSVSMAVVPAMTDRQSLQTVRVQGYEPAEGEDMSPAINLVGPDYFEALGVPLVMGRAFAPGDDERAPLVAIVNQSMAKHFWPGKHPIGRRFSANSRQPEGAVEVVGVVRDAKFANLRGDIPRFFYIPLLQAQTIDAMTFYVRTRPGIGDPFAAVRQTVQRLDPGLPVLDMKSMEQQVSDTLFPERLVALLAVFFGVLATVLAAIGLYGVMSYTVSRRTREIGLRMALGAARASVLWMVLREVVTLTTAGILLGVPAALAVSRLIESQLFGLSSTDPLTLAFAAIVLTLIALSAGYLPAWRATRIDPMIALRTE
jgi:predicted permease